MKTEAGKWICTDESWNVRTGAVRYSEIYMGETIDTTIGEAQDREQSGIRTGSVSVMEFDKSTLTARKMNRSVLQNGFWQRS